MKVFLTVERIKYTYLEAELPDNATDDEIVRDLCTCGRIVDTDENDEPLSCHYYRPKSDNPNEAQDEPFRTID